MSTVETLDASSTPHAASASALRPHTAVSQTINILHVLGITGDICIWSGHWVLDDVGFGVGETISLVENGSVSH